MSQTDEGILHADRLSGCVHHRKSREESKHIKGSLGETGLFHFHRSITMGNGSALLLNKRGAEFLYLASDTEELKKRIGEEVWVPWGPLRNETQFSHMSGQYYKGTIHAIRDITYSSHNIVVQFQDGSFNPDVHISDLRKSNPPPRGRGGHVGTVSSIPIWVAPNISWEGPMKIEIRPSWIPGENRRWPFHGRRMVEFCVPDEQDTRLSWNNYPEGHPKHRKVMLLGMPKLNIPEWDTLNREAEKQLREYPDMRSWDSQKKTHSGPSKFFGDSKVAHYQANIEEVNPDGTLVIRWGNGFTIADYNPDDIPDEELEKVNYRRPLNGTPYNPPEFDAGEYVYIDYERDGDPAYSKVVSRNDDGTYHTSSSFRTKLTGKNGRVIGPCLSKPEEEKTTPHDIILPLPNDNWDCRMASYPEITDKEELTLHRRAANGDGNARSKVHPQCEEDGGILAWMTWLHSPEENVVTEGGTNVRARDVSQFCLGKSLGIEDWYRTEPPIVPVIFKWDLPKESEGLKKRWKNTCVWTEQTRITEDEVKGVPLLHSIYKKSLREHGQEEGLGRVFAGHLMKFAEGRLTEEKQLDSEEDFSNAQVWKPQQEQQYLEIDTLIGEEEAFLARDLKDPRAMRGRWSWNHDILISANIRMENRIIELEQKLKAVEDKKDPVPPKDECQTDGLQVRETTLDPKTLSIEQKQEIQRMIDHGKNENVGSWALWACAFGLGACVIEHILTR